MEGIFRGIVNWLITERGIKNSLLIEILAHEMIDAACASYIRSSKGSDYIFLKW